MLLSLPMLTLLVAPMVQEPAEATPPPPPPAEAAVSEALTLAAAKNQRVLLIWGGDW